MKNNTHSIPVVSLSDFYSEDLQTRAQFIQDVGLAFEKVGFVSLTNHGVDLDLIKKAYSVSQEFFSLPEEAKSEYIGNNHGQRGYTSFGRETAKGSIYADKKAFYHTGVELDPEHPLYDTYPKNIWPSEVPEFKNTLLQLYKQLEAAARDVLKASALYLGEDEHLFSNMITDGNSILRSLHYPKVEDGTLPKSIRAASHEDINLITLLCESTSPGLELLQSNGVWLPIHRLEGQIIINSSDMLKNATNSVFRSTTHRVVNPDVTKNEDRFSLPFFVHPRSDVDLSPIASCIKKVGEQTTRNISAGDFLIERIKELKL